MSELRLLTSADCHLCEHGKAVLDELADEGLLRWREVDADGDEGAQLAASAPPPRPLLLWPDGRVAAYGRLSARRLRKSFARAAG